MTGRMRWALTAVGCVLLLAPAARAADRDAVRRAVERGTAYLKQLQRPDGTFPCNYVILGDVHRPGPMTVGATALAGLTLLECGVPADDPHVRKAVEVVRAATPELTMTYSLALGVLLLDRLGDPADEELIDSLAVRLLAGQDLTNGGWSYSCPPLSDAEAARIRTLVERRSELKAQTAPPRPPKGQRRIKDLPKEIQEQLLQIDRGGASGYAAKPDNSNTQFAMLALWVARRQGIPVDAALGRVDHRFRTTQERDGGWAYQDILGSTPSMTCAGLLGLALSHGDAIELTRHHNRAGSAKEGRLNPEKDPAVRAGLLALGSVIGRPVDVGAGAAGGVPPADPNTSGRGYYFLWSLERAAVAYGLDTIGKKDWYGWGADVLLHSQQNDGSWRGRYAEGGCDTCFALLFLRRANLAPDLSVVLSGRVADPGERSLRADIPTGGEPSPPPGPKPAFQGSDDTGGQRALSAQVPVRGDGAKADPQAVRMAAEVVGAEGEKQVQLLDHLRDSKGGLFTEALALAIPKLNGEAKSKARDALADRLTRMTAATLADKLRDGDAEVRRAAALAAAMKEERSHVPRLIELLNDPQPTVAHAAHAALKSLANQDLGPEPGASKDDVAEAVARWKDWWRQNGK